jgi:hypothetical protein
MTEQSPSERQKTGVSSPPGVSAPSAPLPPETNPIVKIVIALLALLLFAFLGVRWGIKTWRGNAHGLRQPQIEVPAPAPDPDSLLPHATVIAPRISSVEELAQPWSSKEFFIHKGDDGDFTRAVIVRIPGTPAMRPSGYWAFLLTSPTGSCKLEYVAELEKLRKFYGYKKADHPMVGNPCTHAVYDPLKVKVLKRPKDIWQRGAIVQGLDLRPPLGVELQVENGQILAIRAERFR